MLAADKLIVAVEGINISSWIAHHIDEDIQYDQVVELKKESKAWQTVKCTDPKKLDKKY